MMESIMQLKLKVLWLKNFLGFAIDEVVHQTSYPLTSYYFWPRTAAWDQLQIELNSKVWFSVEEKIRILNLVTSIMNRWKEDPYNHKKLREEFQEVNFIFVQY